MRGISTFVRLHRMHAFHQSLRDEKPRTEISSHTFGIKVCYANNSQMKLAGNDRIGRGIRACASGFALRITQYELLAEQWLCDVANVDLVRIVGTLSQQLG